MKKKTSAFRGKAFEFSVFFKKRRRRSPRVLTNTLIKKARQSIVHSTTPRRFQRHK
jgi:hypothetical protein